jgi:hypothetical protein
VRQTEPTGDEVLILADHYRCDFKFFISNEQSAPFEQTDTLYRAHGREFSKQDRAAVQEFLYLCDIEEFLMTELGRRVKEFNFSPSGTYFKGHGEAAAAKFRKTIGHSGAFIGAGLAFWRLDRLVLGDSGDHRACGGTQACTIAEFP